MSWVCIVTVSKLKIETFNLKKKIHKKEIKYLLILCCWVIIIHYSLGISLGQQLSIHCIDFILMVSTLHTIQMCNSLSLLSPFWLFQVWLPYQSHPSGGPIQYHPTALIQYSKLNLHPWRTPSDTVSENRSKEK
jgi:hypothetical protein